MSKSFRQTLLIATAIVGMTVVASAATPDPTPAPKATTAQTSPAVPVAPTAAAPMAPVAPAAAAAVKDDDHNLTARVEQRITDLHAKLQITAAQQPQWDKFTEVMRANARHMVAGFDARVQAMPTMTAPESMQSYAKIAADHADDMQKLVPAFTALYLTMSDDQKHVTDKVFLDEAHGGDPKPAG
jgi:hypothetical protein